jgi:Tol biopolymer transport system component
MTKRLLIVTLIAAGVAAGCGATPVDSSGSPSGTRSPAVASPSSAASPEPSEAAEASGVSTAAPDRPILRQTIAFTFEDVLLTAKGDGTDRNAVTDFPGAPYPYAGPSWSPKGDRLIIRTEEASGDAVVAGYIFGVDADGTDLANLSERSGSRGDAMPAWSPDGTEIVYSAIKPGDSFNQLYVMKADGSAPRKLIETDFEAQYPSWSKTGFIAFAGVVDGGFDIYSVRADGSELTPLTTDSSPDNWPSWSPDGTRIAFFTSRDGNEGIWVMNADGSDQHFLTEGGEPSWSPDGDEIVYNCGGPESAIICAVHPDGSDPVRLFADAGFPAVRP